MGKFSFQNVKTIVSGNPCKVNVANFSGHDVLTTYALDDTGGVATASMDPDSGICSRSNGP